MQLIWVTGPTGKVVKWSITKRTVAATLVGLACTMVLLGMLFQWVGLRVALEHVPELAHKIGGVTSQSEQDRMEAIYRTQLEALHQQMDVVGERLKALEKTKNETLGRVGLDRLLSFSAPSFANTHRGQGGPMTLLPGWGVNAWRLEQQLAWSLAQAQRYDKDMTQMQNRWDQDLLRLHLVPSQLPIEGDFALTGAFGFRLDPFTRLPSLHEGIDFVAPVGTPVLATAAGVVLRAEYSGAYGQMVEIAHADEFVTRYAHLHSLHVKVGDRVAQHASVGSLGNTGRSTGPHLHYEVIYKGRAMHPVKAMAAWAND
jgi:murein DD-endopeptidase MepM/ murein hydrolase activator NlpD